MATKQSAIAYVDVYIMNNNDNFQASVSKFEWKSMVNSGFIMKCTLLDPHFNVLGKILDDSQATYLRQARRKPTPIKFRIQWDNGAATPWRNGIVSNLDAHGSHAEGQFTFVAVDPISYYLNWGDASGKVYNGPIGGPKGVIKQVLDDYVPSNVPGVGGNINVTKTVDETKDNPANYWMMRQDPKTFIASLLDWSSSFTKNNTSWSVANGENGNGIAVKVQETYTNSMQSVARAVGNNDDGQDLLFDIGTDVVKWGFYSDHLLSTYNTKLVTSGISATTGVYYDSINDPKEEHVYVTDANTDKKLVPPIRVQQGYTKPGYDFRGWSYISSIPEFQNAEPTIWYRDYISGRARQTYMDMLNMVMRLKLTVRGEPRLHASGDLGKSKVILNWTDENEGNPRMMHGIWLLYGWHHKFRPSTSWTTDVYLSRLDYNATGKPGS